MKRELFRLGMKIAQHVATNKKVANKITKAIQNIVHTVKDKKEELEKTFDNFTETVNKKYNR
jgi:replicative DNA helicase